VDVALGLHSCFSDEGSLRHVKNRKKSFNRLDTRLRGYDRIYLYLIFVHLLSFPRRRVSRKMVRPGFL